MTTEAPQSMQQFLGHFVGRVLDGLIEAIAELPADQLHFRATEASNSIGFEAWHIFRTADNIVHFAFHRERPLWLQQGLDEAWGFPRLEQGTGMDPAVAHALTFPSSQALAAYGRDVRAAVVPRIEAMSDDELQMRGEIRPWGVIPRQEAIGQTVIAHGNGHLGQLAAARAALGLEGAGF